MLHSQTLDSMDSFSVSVGLMRVAANVDDITAVEAHAVVS